MQASPQEIVLPSAGGHCDPEIPILCLLCLVLLVDLAYGCDKSKKSKKILTTKECNFLIDEVLFKCYKSALKKKDCGKSVDECAFMEHANLLAATTSVLLVQVFGDFSLGSP
ncbi:hypothetical protein FBUS_01819 [Fasciolopsis buskii]|uniref:Uncharacterized protein n=1 Tax=Fasciolopsis buskii TaxID=27845 RepID=A0A8E0RQY7_9TREM|nr:hypothetical protein FBUS_01819 [Fasciolopsis buski]